MKGYEIAAARRTLGLTQFQFGRMLGLAAKSVSDLERARFTAGETLIRLIGAYTAGYRPDDWPKDELAVIS